MDYFYQCDDLLPMSFFRLTMAATLLGGCAMGGWCADFPGAVSSAAVGGVQLTIKGRSDTPVTPSLLPGIEFAGRVGEVFEVGADELSLQAVGPVNWGADQFAGLYYLRFTSGDRSGMYYTIIANDSSRITLRSDGDELSGVAAGDTFHIVRHWTLDLLFPPAETGTAANPLTTSVDFSGAGRRSEILLPDAVASGINLPPAARYFLTSAGWVADVPGYPAAGGTVLAPDSWFIIRQPEAVGQDAEWTVLGEVLAAAVLIPLTSRPEGKQDNPVGLMRPVPVRLADAGLETGFEESLGLAGFQKRDSLLVFDFSGPGFNKAAAKSYIRVNGRWVSESLGQPVADNEMLPAGAGLMIRKARNSLATTAWWKNLPDY